MKITSKGRRNLVTAVLSGEQTLDKAAINNGISYSYAYKLVAEARKNPDAKAEEALHEWLFRAWVRDTLDKKARRFELKL